MSLQRAQEVAMADGGGGGSVYTTMRGATSYLNTLKALLEGLRDLCNSDILQKNDDEWSKVQKLIGDLADKVDGIVNDCKSDMSEMEAIDNLL